MASLADVFRKNMSLEDGAPLAGLVQSFSAVPTALGVHGLARGLNAIDRTKRDAETIGGVMDGRVDPMSDEAVGAVTDAAMAYGGTAFSAAPVRPGPGMFGGRLDPKMRDLALSMEADRYTPTQILEDTGIFRGQADKKLRNEISDHDAKFKFEPQPGLSFSGTVGDLLDHPRLFDPYPELANIPLRLKNMQGGAFGEHGADGIGLTTNYTGHPRYRGPRDMLSTMLHELQHAVQQREGFADGGSPEFIQQMRPTLTKLRDDPLALQQMVNDPKLPAMQDPAWRDAFVEKLSALTNLKPFDAYQLLAGEEEARLTQARRGMTGSERRIVEPWRTQVDMTGQSHIPVPQNFLYDLYLRENGFNYPYVAP